MLMWLIITYFVYGFVLIGNYFCRTQSGTFKEGNLLVNKDGVRIVSQSEDEAVTYFYLNFYFLFVCF
jgi:hypothetical protein